MGFIIIIININITTSLLVLRGCVSVYIVETGDKSRESLLFSSH